MNANFGLITRVSGVREPTIAGEPMRIADVSHILPAELPGELPLELRQVSSRSSTLLRLFLLFPATLALLLPFLLLADHVVHDADMWLIIETHPRAVLQIGLALAFWTVLFAWPLMRIAESFASSRFIEIDRRTVTVIEKNLVRTTTWVEPLSAYSGIAHNVRASLSGVRHELVLVHPDRERSVLVAMAPRLTQAEIDAVTRAFGLTEVPSGDLYRFGPQPAGKAANDLKGLPA